MKIMGVTQSWVTLFFICADDRENSFPSCRPRNFCSPKTSGCLISWKGIDLLAPLPEIVMGESEVFIQFGEMRGEDEGI